ncbi:MAG: alpha/beta fold hydrolase [Myxococcota bacterium]
MILRSDRVRQVLDGTTTAELLKDVIMTPGTVPHGMVRKRRAEGPTYGAVMLVHGFGQNRYAWHTDQRSFSAYLAADGWDVFNADLRGHGRSRRFGSRRPEVLAEYIRHDLPACAREALRLSDHDQIYLVGHSMGGIVSYGAAATSMRDVVAGVASIGSPYRFGHGSIFLTSMSKLLRTLRFTGMFDSNPTVPLRLLGRHFQKRRRVWDSRFFPTPLRLWRPGSIEPPILDEYLRRAYDWTTMAIALDILKAGEEGVLDTRVGRWNYHAAFEWLDLPLLVIAGSHDLLAPPSSVRPAYDLSRSSDRIYREFPMGHLDLLVGQSAPSTVWPTLRDWLRRQAGAEAQARAAS